MNKPILLTLCLAVSACHQPAIEVGLPPPPTEWMVCEPLPATPDLSPLQVITLDDGRKVYLKSETDARDGQIARYILAVRGSWFSCSNNLAKINDYYEGVE